MAARVMNSGPERLERDLVWGILFALKGRGVDKLDNTGGLLHRVFARLFDEEAAALRGALGFIPQPHPLFGEYRCITEALDSAHRAGLVGFMNPTYRQVVLQMHPDTADSALQKLAIDVSLAKSLADRFLTHYSELSDLDLRN